MYCPSHGPTVAQVPWARHDTVFTRAFEDLVVYDASASNKTTQPAVTGCRGGR